MRLETNFLNNKHVQIKVSKDVKADDEEGVRVKEQAILDLGSLLKQTKKAKGKKIKHLWSFQQFKKKFKIINRIGRVDCIHTSIPGYG